MHCRGGQPSSVADYIKKYGIAYESDYLYKAKKETCRAKYYLNKSKSRTGERFLEMLLSEDMQYPKENSGRNLQSSYFGFPDFFSDFDNGSDSYNDNDYYNKNNDFYDYRNQPYNNLFSGFNFKGHQSKRSRSSRSKKKNSHEKRYEEVEGYFFINESVVDVINALQYGPVVTAHYAPKSFKYYSRGVYDTRDCRGKRSKDVNHSTLIVGYNLDAKIPYFEMRNSWGKDWGDNGYFKMKMGRVSKSNKGLCLIAGTPYMIVPYLFI